MSVATEHRNAKAAEASLRNELITRQRVDHLESFAGAIGQHVDQLETRIDATATITAAHMDFLQLGLLGRLRWLIAGTLPIREPVSSPVTKSSEVALD